MPYLLFLWFVFLVDLLAAIVLIRVAIDAWQEKEGHFVPTLNFMAVLGLNVWALIPFLYVVTSLYLEK